MHPSMSLTMAKGELIAAVEVAQIMLLVMRVLEDIGLHVKTPMILQVYCKDAHDLTYCWDVSGLTKHVLVWTCFLCKIKRGKSNVMHFEFNHIKHGAYIHQKCLSMIV